MDDLSAGFLAAPAPSPEAERLYDGDRKGDGYVANVTKLWAHQPALLDGVADVLGKATEAAGITFRQRAVLVTATASALGDSYCSLAWGKKLASAASPAIAAGVLSGIDDGLDPVDQVLAAWARQVVRDPNGSTADDVEPLRRAGFTDAQIFAITAYVAMRLAFAVVNDALGARPDHELEEALPEQVRAAVTYGRAIAEV